jgi:hypothetical protein
MSTEEGKQDQKDAPAQGDEQSKLAERPSTVLAGPVTREFYAEVAKK